MRGYKRVDAGIVSHLMWEVDRPVGVHILQTLSRLLSEDRINISFNTILGYNNHLITDAQTDIICDITTFFSSISLYTGLMFQMRQMKR